jgi:hypothetical protein
VFEQMRRQAARQRWPLDLRAFNSLLLAQLAAGAHESVLGTFQRMEAEEELRPDATTLQAVISACRAAGWRQQEAQYRRLLEGSRLLGALRGDEDGDGSRSGGRRRGGGDGGGNPDVD